jgi:predicted neuraminidase
MKKLIVAFAYLTASLNLAIAQTPPFKSGILEDDFVYDVAPFPQCHASTIVETPKGLVCAFFGGTREKNPDVEIYLCRRDGNKWTAPVSVANGIQNTSLRYPTWNPVLYQVPGGDLLLFYKVGPSPSTWKGWLKASKDNGLTWSEAKALPDGFIGPVKNKPVLVRNQRLVAPSSKEDNGWQVHFEISDDFGKSWKMVGPINDGKSISAIQPSVLIHKDGKLQILARSENRAIMEAWSSDNGDTWSTLTKSSLPNNNSGIDAVTLKDGRHLVVYNHILAPGNKAGGPRTPLNLSYSSDGKTWYATLVLENSPIGEYSYPSIIQSADGMVHIVYTWRRQKVKYVKIDPTKLEGKKIENGLWPY